MPQSPRRDTAAMRRKAAIARRAEMQFAVALRKVAKKIDVLTRKTFKAKKPLGSSQQLKALLTSYGQTLRPWALATAKRMVVDVERRDEKFWKDQSALISKGLKSELRTGTVAVAVRERTAEAAGLITSLPLEAALRVEKLSIKYMTQGIRANQLVKDIMRTGEVTKSRANTIARTETSRTAGILQQVRAESVGSDGYIWRTAGDIDVRDIHARLEGKFFRWSNPPIAGTNGERAHPGGIYNCRCWAEIVLPGERRPSRNRFVAEEVSRPNVSLAPARNRRAA